MKTSVKQRLEQFIKYRKFSVHQFEQLVGLSNGYVRNIRKSITQDKLEQIALTFPELSKEWLIFGEGEMIKCYFDIPQEEQQAETSKENVSLLQAKEETIHALRSQLDDKDAIISKNDLIRLLEQRIRQVEQTYNYDIPISPIGVAELPLQKG